MKRWIMLLLMAALALSCASFAEQPGPSDSQMDAAVSTGAQSADPVGVDVAQPLAEGTRSPVEADALPAPDALPDPEEVAELTAQSMEPEVTHTVWFEEGFGLSIPDGWVSYPVSDEDRSKGIRYALGDGSGNRYLYIQIAPTGLRTAAELAEAVDREDDLSRTGELEFGDSDFVAFIDAAQNASCCATLWRNSLAVFVFTPQTDADFMLTATQLMETFSTP